MRSIWQGGISFGLVYIPVKLYSATKSTVIDFDLLSKDDLAPIRYARVNTSTGEEVPWDHIVKGYQYRKGDYVVLHDEDFKKVSVKKTKAIDIIDFVDRDEIDPIYLDKPYYLEPDKNARKTYALLVEALQKSKKVGVAKFVLRNREHLALLEPQGELLILNQMRFKDEIRPVTELDIPENGLVSKKELEMAVDLIEKMSDPFDPAKFKDEYNDELLEIIDDKIHHKKSESPGKQKMLRPTKVTDLMAQLKASLKRKPALH